MTGILASVLLASLAGSLHCAAMCGGLVSFATADTAGQYSWRVRAQRQLIYQGGRLFSYVTLGIAAGSIGSMIDLAGSYAGWRQSALFFSGALMITWSLLTLLKLFQGRPNGLSRLGTKPAPPWSSRLISQLYGLNPNLRAGLMGSVTGLLPCGWLYAFVVTASGTGSAPMGALVMTSFWLGSIPILMGLGGVVSSLTRRLGTRAPVVSAALLLALGLSTLWQRANVEPPPPNGQATSKPSCH